VVLFHPKKREQPVVHQTLQFHMVVILVQGHIYENGPGFLII
jgi:hypothetical protein